MKQFVNFVINVTQNKAIRKFNLGADIIATLTVRAPTDKPTFRSYHENWDRIWDNAQADASEDGKCTTNNDRTTIRHVLALNETLGTKVT